MLLPRHFPRRSRRGPGCPSFVLVIGAVAPALAPSFSAVAQPAQLAPVFVTATRTPQPIASLVADVTVIDADEIARSGAQSLADLLQRQAGIEIVRNGGPGATSGIFIRGANRGQTLLLIDGVRVASSTVGAPTPEAVPLAQIERIEILRGPASSLYGADAIGGVVQIFTRQPSEGIGGHASTGYGTHLTRTASGGIFATLGALRLGVQAGARRSDGFNATTDPSSFVFNADRDGYASDDIGANAALALAPGHEVVAQYLRNRLDAQFDGGPGFDDRTLTTLERWRLASSHRLAAGWQSRLSIGEGTDDSVSRTGFGDFAFRTRERQYAWQNELALPAGQLVLAVERREERVNEDAGFAVSSRSTNAALAVWQWRHDTHAVQANLRHDRSSQYGGRTTGAIAWGVALTPQWRATASYGTAFKAPSFNDLYFPGFSNPSLVPETSRNFEAGLRWTRRSGDVAAELRAVAWRNEVDRLIVFQCDPSFNCAPQNVDSATLQGITLGADGSWRDTTFKASIDLQQPKDDATGRLLPRRARQHGTLALAQSVGPVRVGVEVVGSSHRYDDAENLRRLAGYAIVNVSAEWRLEHGVAMFARIDNLADRDYVLASGFATGGTQGFVGVRWQR